MRPASVGFQCPSCVKEGNASVRAPRAEFGGRASLGSEITYGLIGLNVLAFLVTTVSGTGFLFGGNPSALFARLALVPQGFQQLDPDGSVQTIGGVAGGQYYRLLTSTFLHFGIIHIALNMYALFLLGPQLERVLGKVRFLALYLLSGLAGAALSYALGPVHEQAAGASGAVFGLFAAFFVVQRRRGGDVSQIGTTIAINLFISFAASSYIDWRGHVGGLVGGGLVTLALVHAPSGPKRSLVQGGGVALVAALVVGVVAVRTAVLT